MIHLVVMYVVHGKQIRHGRVSFKPNGVLDLVVVVDNNAVDQQKLIKKSLKGESSSDKEKFKGRI